MSAGAACQNLLVAANLMGFAAQWLTEWYAYDETIDAKLGLKSGERVAGFVYIGSATTKPDEPNAGFAATNPALDRVITQYREGKGRENMQDVVIVDAARSPVGRKNGGLGRPHTTWASHDADC